MSAQPKPVSILLVEDNPLDAELSMRALNRSGLSDQVSLAQDGQEALDLLAGGHISPGLIVLDLNLPKINGIEVLKEIKANPLLRRIPVVILTTSDSIEDITASYDFGANGYVCKPMTFEDYSRVVDSIRQFWTQTAELPPRARLAG